MKRLLFCTIFLFLTHLTYSQVTCNGNWGQYLINQTFGAGNATNNWYGPLATYAPGATTSTIFVGAAGPPGVNLTDGYSGLVVNSNVAGGGANWISTTDHTGDPYGLMLLVNAPSTASTVFFEYTMDNLCANTTLKLSCWVINVNSGLVLSNTCGTSTQYPNLTLRVVDPVTNTILSSTATGNVPLDSAWHQYSVIFNNGNNTSVKLQIVNNSVGSGCGNDLALDDITVQPCIPESLILPSLDTTVCSNTTINFEANVISSPYNPAEFQWQYSADLGATWTNFGPASPSPTYDFNTANFPVGQYMIRYITGPSGATTNANCVAISDTSNVTVDSVDITHLYETICSSQTFDFFGNQLSTSGIYDSAISSLVTSCDSLVRLHLTVVPSPSKIFMLDTIIACQYDSVAFETNTIPSSPNYTYQWDPQTNLNSSTDPNVWFNADASRRYVLTVTNAENNVLCSLKDTLEVIVNPGDFLQIALTDTGICPGDSLRLQSAGANSYSWNPATHLSNANVANPIAKPEISTVYRIIGYSLKGCTDTQFVNVTVHPAAILELPDAINLFPGESYSMNPGTNAVFFNWFPNSGINDDNISNPILNPTVDTRYFVSAKTEFGCAILDSVDVWVKGSVINMPNAFNPNQGTLKPVYRGTIILENFSVYNRWGQKVFETKNINDGWDGYFQSVPQPLGVYIYQITAKTIEGKPFKKTGDVTLIR